MAEFTVRIKPDDIVERVIDEVAYNGKTIREWANLLTNPKTNADRIRSMSDEELAKLFGQSCDCDNAHCFVYDKDVSCMNGCASAWLQWLQSPVEVDE